MVKNCYCFNFIQSRITTQCMGDTPLTTSDYDAIIFIPSVGGSQLEWKLDPLDVILCARIEMSSWAPEPDALFVVLYSFVHLSSDSSGNSDSNIYVNGILEKFWPQDIYGNFIKHLKTNLAVKAMVGNFQSMYDFLPSQKYLDKNNGYYINHNSSYLTSMQDTKAFLNSRTWANSNLLNKGITFQNSLNYETNSDFESVDKYLIMGDSMSTIVGFKAVDGNAI